MNLTYSDIQIKKSKMQIGLLLFLSVFVISHFVYSLGFRAMVVIPLSMFMLLTILIMQNRKIPTWALFIVLLSFGTSSLTGLYWASWKATLFPAFLGISILIVSVATKYEIEKTVKLASTIMLLMLVGAWIAFFFAILGYESAGTFHSASGRAIEYYYTSLAIPYRDNFIRASGLYDEPGTFSFIVCIFAFLRHMMGLNKKTTWIMLLLGFVTFSLAHLIYVIFHVIAERNLLKTIKNIALAGSIFIVLLSALGAWHFFEERLIGRLETSTKSDRVIVGDNRTQHLLKTTDILTDKMKLKEIMLGIDVSCVEGTFECSKYASGVGFNPLSPLVHYGLLISWPYYLFILFLLIVGVSQRGYIALIGVVLLFMQRPFVLSSGYAMLCALVVFAIIRDQRFIMLQEKLKNQIIKSSYK